MTEYDQAENVLMNKKAEKILDTTMKLFIHGGVRKVSMDEIAEYAGVSKVTIYKYFKDKDTLYLKLGKRILSGSASMMESIAASGEPLVKKLYGFLESVSDFADGGKYALCRELARHHSGVEEEFGRYRQACQKSLLTLIDEGISNSLIKSGLERDMVFYAIDMGVAYYQNNPEYRGRMLRDDTFRQRFLLFLVGNILADGEGLLMNPAR